MIILICIGLILYSIVVLIKFIKDMVTGKGCGDCTGCDKSKGGKRNCD